MTTETSQAPPPTSDPVEGVWDFNYVDKNGKVLSAIGRLRLDSGQVQRLDGEWSGGVETVTYEVVEDSVATSLEITLSGTSVTDGLPASMFWHCTLSPDGAVLTGWVEADTISKGSETDTTSTRARMLMDFEVSGTRALDDQP